MQHEYVVHATEQWLVLPYELHGLSADDVRQHKPFLERILAGLSKI